VRFVQDDDNVAAAFVFFSGEQTGGLWDEHRLLIPGGAAQGEDDPGVQAAGPDGRVAEVDDGGAAGVQAGQGGADRDGLAGADLTGDDPEGLLGEASADPGDRFAVVSPRSWLYAQADLRHEVERLRARHQTQPSSAVPPQRQQASDASLLRRLEAATERIRDLERDNRELSDALAQALGARRTSAILGATSRRDTPNKKGSKVIGPC